MAKKSREPTPEEIIAQFDKSTIDGALALRNDPVLFCQVALGFTPHKRQAEFLRLPIWEQYHVMLPWGRQMGKSFIVAAFVAWALFAFRDFRVYLFSPAEDQSKAIFNQVVKFYKRSPILKALTTCKESGDEFTVGGSDWGAFCELVKVGHKGRLGRSRSTAGRGIIIFEEYNVFDMQEDVKAALTPIMRSGGGEVVLSSPGDPGGPMHRIYELWKQTQAGGNDRYHVIECSINDVDHLPAEFAEDCKREMSEWMYRRELLGEWVAPADQFFAWEDLQRCILPARPPYNPRDAFVWTADWGGRGRSAAVVAIARYVASLQRLEVVELLQFYFTNHKYHRDTGSADIIDGEHGWGQIEDILLDLRERYPPIWFGVDPATENSLSGRLANVYHFPISEILVGGYAKKEMVYTALQAGIRAQKLVWNHAAITDQLRAFCPTRKDNGQYEFPKANTDIVVCMMELYQYLAQMEVTPFAVAAGVRETVGRNDAW
jgi:hypothetical protein